MVKLAGRFICSIILIIMFSCGDSEDELDNGFKNQDLSGMVNGISWTYKKGFVNPTFEAFDLITFRLSNDETKDECSPFDLGRLQVHFDTPNETGLYVLERSTKTASKSTEMELKDFDNSLTIIPVGFLEILSITREEIKGRINANADENNFINGNFTINVCP